MASIFESALVGSRMVVSSTLYGPIEVDIGAAATAKPGPPNPLLAWVRPQVQLYQGGGLIYTWAPYGTPTPIDWGVVALVALLVGMLGLLVRLRSA